MSRSSNATTTKATAEFNQSSINNFDNDKSIREDLSRESTGFLKPRAPPPRPDSPPMNPMDHQQEEFKLKSGRQTFGIVKDEMINDIHPDQSWAVSPLDNKIQQNYQSQFMSGSGVKNAGLIKLLPLNYGKTPSPQTLQQGSMTVSNLYREKFKPPINLQPITCLSPDQKDKYMYVNSIDNEDDNVIEQQEQDYGSNNVLQQDQDDTQQYEKSLMEGTGSIVCKGSPQRLFKAFNNLSSTPKIKKTKSKTQQLLQGKIGSSARKNIKSKYLNQKSQIEQEQPTISPCEQKNSLNKIITYRSPANRYDPLLSEQSDTPGRASHRSKQSTAHLFQNTMSKTPSNLESSRAKLELRQEVDLNRSFGSHTSLAQNKRGSIIKQQLSNDSQSCLIDFKNCYPENKTPINNQISSRDYTTVKMVNNSHRNKLPIQIDDNDQKENKEFQQSPPPIPAQQPKAFSPLRQSFSNSKIDINSNNTGAKLKTNKVNSSSHIQDGFGSEQRKQRQIEKLRRQEAVQKRKGLGASPTRPKVSGGMSRKPNFALKKEILRFSINNSNQKLNHSLVSSRRGSHNIETFNNSQNETSFRHAEEYPGFKRGGGAIVRQLSKTPRLHKQNGPKLDQKQNLIKKDQSIKTQLIQNRQTNIVKSHMQDEQQVAQKLITKQLEFHDNSNRAFSKKGVVGSAISRTNSKAQIGMNKRRQKSDFVIGITAGGHTSRQQSCSDMKMKSDDMNSTTTGPLQIQNTINQYKRHKKPQQEVKTQKQKQKKQQSSKSKYVPLVQKSKSCKKTLQQLHNILEVSFDVHQSSFTYRGGQSRKEFLTQKINELNLSRRQDPMKLDSSPIFFGVSTKRELNTCSKFSPFVQNLMKSSRKSKMNTVTLKKRKQSNSIQNKDKSQCQYSCFNEKYRSCPNCARLLSKGLSSAYCTMHSRYNAAPSQHFK